MKQSCLNKFLQKSNHSSESPSADLSQDTIGLQSNTSTSPKPSSTNLSEDAATAIKINILPESLVKSGHPQCSQPDTSSSQTKDIFSDESVFRHTRKNGRHYIKCKPCAQFPDIVKKFTDHSRFPQIITADGAIFRKETAANHLAQPYHRECVKACRINTLSNVEKSHATAIGKTISKMNADLADKIGRLMLHTYSDAKK